jgi:hypothetical protein
VRPRHSWESNIKLSLKEMGCEVVGWMQLALKRSSGELF